MFLGGVFVAASLLAAAPVVAQQIGDVFVIPMENHNWTQPSSDNSAPSQILGNPDAPYINSLVTAGNANAAQVSYAANYYNVLATAAGNGPSIHPSEPNYLWSEGGTNYGVLDDNEPYQSSGGTDQSTTQHLSGILQVSGQTWKSYQEDTDINTSSGAVLSQSQWTVPLFNASGSVTARNAYNGSTQYNYATKHNPMALFTDTNGGDNTTSSNPLASHYAPLQQLQTDLNNNTVARYNWITPDLYNDMHTALPGGFTIGGVTYTNDAAEVKQGDNFLSIIIPEIMASQAYKNNGVIVIWNDETEGTNPNDFTHTMMEIVISPLAKGNAYKSTLAMSHSSDLKTWQELFNIGPANGYALLGDAATAGTNDLSDLFEAGAIIATGFTAWQNTHFTPVQLLNSAICGDTANPSGDGISNLMKYALNMNPNTPSASGLPASRTVLVSGSSYLTLTYKQVIAATDLTYRPEVSGDLINWNSGGGYTTLVSSTPNGDGVTETVIVQDNVAASGTNSRFMRLEVQGP